MDFNSGRLRLRGTSGLDFEALPNRDTGMVHLVIVACDLGSPAKCSNVSLVVTVEVRSHFPDEVNVSELPSMYQGVWSATVCQLPSQLKRPQERLSSFGIAFKRMYFFQVYNHSHINKILREEIYPVTVGKELSTCVIVCFVVVLVVVVIVLDYHLIFCCVFVEFFSASEQNKPRFVCGVPWINTW